MIIGSKDLIRNLNTKLVLKEIIENEPVSRTDLSKKLGLTKATISSIVQNLLALNVIIETGSCDTEMGRKPIFLNFNPKSGYAVSINIDSDLMTVLITDLYSEDRQIKQIKTPPPDKFHSSITEIIDSAEGIISKTYYGLTGITISIDHKIKDLIDSLSTFTNSLEQYYNIPIFIEDKASLYVIGETLFINRTFNKFYTNVIYINIEEHINVGIILDNKLYKGSQNKSGNIDHYIIVPDGRPCKCGKKGCLEQYISKQSILKDYRLLTMNETLDFSHLTNGIKNHEPYAMKVSDSFLYYLFIFINNIKLIYDPEILIINSHITNCFPELISETAKKFSELCDGIEILPAHSDINTNLTGGICLSVTDFLEKLITR